MNKQGLHLHEQPPSIPVALNRDCHFYVVLNVDAEWAIPAIKQADPLAGVILRMYHPSVMERPIDEWVDLCKAEYDRWQPLCLVPANELNLAREHQELLWGDNFWDQQAYWESPAGYYEQRAWWLAFMQHWAGYGPLGVLALSPGHNEDGPDNNWSGYEILRPIVEHPQATYLILHTYWEQGRGESLCWGLYEGQDPYWYAFRPLRPVLWKNHNQPQLAVAPDPGGAMVMFPDKAVLITEANRLWKRGDDFDEQAVAEEWAYFYRRYAALPQVKAICWYQESGNDGEGSETFNVCYNPHLAYKMRTMEKEIPEGEMSMPEFKFGVLAEAERLRTLGVEVGEPLWDEKWFIADMAVQPTTKGAFWVFKHDGNFEVQYHPKKV